MSLWPSWLPIPLRDSEGNLQCYSIEDLPSIFLLNPGVQPELPEDDFGSAVCNLASQMGLKSRSLDIEWVQKFNDHPVKRQTQENDPEAYFKYSFEYLMGDPERLNSLLEIVSHTPQTVLNDRYIIVLGLTEEEGKISNNSDGEVEEESEKIPAYVVVDLKRLRKLRKKKLIIPRTPVSAGSELYGENLMWSIASSTVKEAEIDDFWVAKDLVVDENAQLYTHPYPEDLHRPLIYSLRNIQSKRQENFSKSPKETIGCESFCPKGFRFINGTSAEFQQKFSEVLMPVPYLYDIIIPGVELNLPLPNKFRGGLGDNDQILGGSSTFVSGVLGFDISSLNQHEQQLFRSQNSPTQQQQLWQEYVEYGTAARLVRIAPISAFAFEDLNRIHHSQGLVQLLCCLAIINKISEPSPDNPRMLIAFHANIRDANTERYRGVSLKLENLVDIRASSYDDGYNPNFVQFNRYHWELDNRVGFIDPNNVTENSRTNNGRINVIPMNRDGAMVAETISRSIVNARFPVFNELLRKSPNLAHSTDRDTFRAELEELGFAVIEPDEDENIREIIEYLPQTLTYHGKSIDGFRSGIESLIADQPDLCNSCLCQLTEAIVLSAGDNINKQELGEDRTVALLQSIKQLSDLFTDSSYEFPEEYQDIIALTANVQTQFISIEDELRKAINLNTALSKLERKTRFSREGPGFRNKRRHQPDYDWFRIDTDSGFPVRWADEEGQTSHGIEFIDESTRLYRIRQSHWSIITEKFENICKGKNLLDAVNYSFKQFMHEAYDTIFKSSYDEESIEKPPAFEELRRWILSGAISWYNNLENITPTDKKLDSFLRDVARALDVGRHEENDSNEMFPNTDSPFATGSRGWSFELAKGSQPRLVIRSGKITTQQNMIQKMYWIRNLFQQYTEQTSAVEVLLSRARFEEKFETVEDRSSLLNEVLGRIRLQSIENCVQQNWNELIDDDQELRQYLDTQDWINPPIETCESIIATISENYSAREVPAVTDPDLTQLYPFDDHPCMIPSYRVLSPSRHNRQKLRLFRPNGPNSLSPVIRNIVDFDDRRFESVGNTLYLSPTAERAGILQDGWRLVCPNGEGTFEKYIQNNWMNIFEEHQDCEYVSLQGVVRFNNEGPITEQNDNLIVHKLHMLYMVSLMSTLSSEV